MKLAPLVLLAFALEGCSGPSLSGKYFDDAFTMDKVDHWEFTSNGTWTQTTFTHHKPRFTSRVTGTYTYDGKSLDLSWQHLYSDSTRGYVEHEIPGRNTSEVFAVSHSGADLVIDNRLRGRLVLHPEKQSADGGK